MFWICHLIVQELGAINETKKNGDKKIPIDLHYLSDFVDFF